MGWSVYKAYIVGGYSSSNLQDTAEYDAETWMSKSDLPSPGRSSFAASTISNKGHVYGGYDGTNRLNDTDEYILDTWTSKSDMPSPPRNSLTASTVSDKGYIFGGTDGNELSDTDEYDPDTWTSKTNIPSPVRRNLASSNVSDKGYVFAGRDNSSNYLQDTDEYDPDTWTNKSDMPAPARYVLAASTISDKGYIYGGHYGGFLQDTDEYDPDTWTSKSDMPSPARGYSAASTLFSKGYVYGGYDGSNLKDIDEYNPDTWANKADMPVSERRDMASFSLGSCCVSPNTNHAYFYDPYIFNSSSEGVEIYDSSTDSSCAIAYILYDSGINCTTKIGESNLLLATTNSGIKSFNTTNISGTTASPADLSSYLADYKSYPEITDNNVKYIHAACDYLCVATLSGIDHFNTGNSDGYSRSSMALSSSAAEPFRCFQTCRGRFYYVLAAKPEFRYRRPLNLSTATSLSDVQISVQLNTSNFDYSKVRADGGDIRFYDSGGTKLDYHLWTWNYGGTSTFWVEVTSSGTDTIYIHYGNENATSESDPDATWQLYDDFEGSSLDSSKWPTVNQPGQIIVSGSKVNIVGNSSYPYIRSSSTLTPPLVAEQDLNVISTHSLNGIAHFGNRLVGGGGTDGTVWYKYSGGNWRLTINGSSSWESGTAPYTGSGIYRSYIKEDGVQVTWTSGSLNESWSGTTNPAGNRAFQIFEGYTGSEAEIDWFRVRKYDSGNPSVSSIGAEEDTRSGQDLCKAIYTYQCDWSDNNVGYTYDTTVSGLLPGPCIINDFHVVEGPPNLLFFATTSGVTLIEEKIGDEANARYKHYLLEG